MEVGAKLQWTGKAITNGSQGVEVDLKGETAIVARYDDDFYVTWEKQGKTLMCTHLKDNWSSHFKFVSAAPKLQVGTKIKALPNVGSLSGKYGIITAHDVYHEFFSVAFHPSKESSKIRVKDWPCYVQFLSDPVGRCEIENGGEELAKLSEELAKFVESLNQAPHTSCIDQQEHTAVVRASGQELEQRTEPRAAINPTEAPQNPTEELPTSVEPTGPVLPAAAETQTVAPSPKGASTSPSQQERVELLPARTASPAHLDSVPMTPLIPDRVMISGRPVSRSGVEYYRLMVPIDGNSSTREVQKRYNDFVELSRQLEEFSGIRRPELPGKEHVGFRRRLNATGFIDKRRQGLQKYLDELIGQEGIRTNPAFAEFLQEASVA